MQTFKLFLCHILLAFVVSRSFGQTEFGNFTSYEQNLKICDFDKEADAVVLFDVANANYNDEYNLIVTRNVRMKILKEKGIQRGNIEIPYYKKNKFESILNIRAIVQTTDETGKVVVRELKKADIFEQAVNDRVAVVKFALPNVKVGSIIEYSYVSICKDYGGLQDWHFQSDIPTQLSRFNLLVIPNANFSYAVHKAEELPIDIKKGNGNGIIEFEMKNIPGLRDEPFMDASKDYIQRVEFQLASYSTGRGSEINYITSWDDVSKELMGEADFGKVIDKKLPDSEGLISKIKAEATPEEKLKFIYNYIRQGFTWNGINSKYATDGLKPVWEKRTGTSGEINLLLINLLKKAGFQVYPLLVSERDNGKIDPQTPMLNQFNKVVAYIELNGKKMILDATEQYTPVDLIPFDILNTKAFIVHTKKGGLIDLNDEGRTHSNKIEVSAVVAEDGTISGSTTVTSSDYAKVERLRTVKSNKEKFVNTYFTKNNGEIKIDGLELKNEDIDTLALEQRFKFTASLPSSGNYRLLNLNWFSDLDKNPFISDNRFSNINFGNSYITEIHEKFVIPATLKPDAIPKNVNLAMFDQSIVFTRVVKSKDNEIDVQLTFRINKSVFTPGEYSNVKEYYRKMNEFLNEQVVLSNK